MSRVEELEDKVKELMNEIETLKQQEKAEKFEYLFEIGEQCWFISSSGSLFRDTWDTALISFDRYHQGNVFKTKEEAEREREKRILLTRFRQFRDKCNGEWEPGTFDCKYFIAYDSFKNVLESSWNDVWDNFNTFGYFKNERDCLRAIELFGDEIIRLWGEVD
nr:MAG TPA: GCN4-pII/Tumor necrosis factor ligand superfamily, Glucocorticoid-Induced TNF Receptor Ligand.95A [Caudoviricetes sp.]